MNTKKLTKLLALYLPYVLLGLVATNIGEAWRLAEGKELGDKIMAMMGTLPVAFANPLPSLHPLDLIIGLSCGAGLRLAVYLRSKNAKKYRHGMEYGSARWGNAKDIEPFQAPKFADNIILTKTERLMMSNRPPDPKNARNKNVLVVGGSGSGKTRFWLKPNLLQCHSSYVVTDPKGTIVLECGQAMLKNGYRVKILNTINFKKSMHYNPFSYVHSEKDIEGGSNWLSRWKQRQEIRKGYYATARSGSTAAQTAGGKKAASGGTAAVQSGVEQVVDKGKSAVSAAVNGLMTAAKSNAHTLVIVGVFLLLLLLVMSGFSSCSIIFSGTTQVGGQTIYTAEDRDIRGAEEDYKKLEKELEKKIQRTPQEHPGYDEYQYHLDPIEHDPWQLTSFLSTLYDDYTRSEVQGKLQEIFKKQYKLTTWVEVQTRYKTVIMIDPLTGMPYTVQVPYEYRIFHTKLENKGLEVIIRQELNDDQWKRYQIFQETLGGRPYLFNGGLPPGGSDGSGAPGIDYTVPAEALTDSEFAAIYEEAKKYIGTPYVWGGSTPETGFDCSGYVCWVYNQAGYDVGRTTANGLWNQCQHISEAEAKPGDLVFFKGTYDTPGMSHVGLYLGNGMMVSAGDPIKYANIHSSYWESHLAGFGRLSK